MKSYSVSEISKESFDLSLLTYDKEELSDLARVIQLNYILTLEQQRKTCKPGEHYYNYVYLPRVFDESMKSIDWKVRFIFNESLKLELPDLLNFHHSTKKDIIDSIDEMIRCHMYELKSIHDKIFVNSENQSLREISYSYGCVKTSSAIHALKKNGIGHFNCSGQKHLLELISADDAVQFIKSEHEEIRLLAYKKLGATNYIDHMLADKCANIREAGVNYMDNGDPRVRLLIKEKTKKVLYVALLKAPADILPFFIGNNFIKKDYGLNDLFRQRMEQSSS